MNRFFPLFIPCIFIDPINYEATLKVTIWFSKIIFKQNPIWVFSFNAIGRVFRCLLPVTKWEKHAIRWTPQMSQYYAVSAVIFKLNNAGFRFAANRWASYWCSSRTRWNSSHHTANHYYYVPVTMNIEITDTISTKTVSGSAKRRSTSL